MEVTPELIQELAKAVKALLANESQGVGEIIVVKSLDNILSLPALRVVGDDETVVEAPLTLLRVSLRRSEAGIQWRQGDDGEWKDLILIPDITGPQGLTPEYRTGNTGIEWKYTTEPETAWRVLVTIDKLQLTFDMLTESQKEAIRGYSAYQLWIKENGNEGKSYDDYKAFNKQDALDAAKIAVQATEDSIQQTDISVITTGKARIVLNDVREIGTETEVLIDDTLVVRQSTSIVSVESSMIKNETQKVCEGTDLISQQAKQEITRTEDICNEVSQELDKVVVFVEKIEQLDHETQIIQEGTKTECELSSLEREKGRLQHQLNSTFLEDASNAVAKSTLISMQCELERRLMVELQNTTEELVSKMEIERIRARIAVDIAIELSEHPMEIRGGVWFRYSLDAKDYITTNIQAKGDTGPSFRIFTQFNTFEELIESIPDGNNIDGVAAVGIEEPFNYYSWVSKNGVWAWRDQGKLRGAEGKSSYEVWKEHPENADKSEKEYFDWLSPIIDKTGRWNIQGTDTGVQALGINAEVTEKENAEDSYILHVKSAKGEFDTPNIRGISVKVTEKENTSDTYILTFKHAKGEFTTPNLRGFDVKVEEVEGNTPDDYKLKITTVEGEFVTPNLQGRSGSAVIDIDHEPTEADTHYTYNNVRYAFSVGDEVRWYDKDSEEYVLFKLYAVTEVGTVWEEMGSGGVSLPTDVILCSPEVLSSDEADSYIYLEDGTLKGKEN